MAIIVRGRNGTCQVLLGLMVAIYFLACILEMIESSDEVKWSIDEVFCKKDAKHEADMSRESVCADEEDK